MLRLVPILLLLLAPVVGAAIINVPAVQPTIVDGVTAAQDGDTILVAPGQYNESVVVDGKGVFILSSHGPEVTYLTTAESKALRFDRDGEPDIYCLHFRNIYSKRAEFSGFTISYNEHPCAGTVIISHCDSMRFSNNIVCHNFVVPGSWAQIVYANQSGGEIVGNVFYHNDGTAAAVAPFPGAGQEIVVARNTIHGNNGGILCGLTPEDTADHWVRVSNNCITNSGLGVYGHFKEIGCNNVWNNTFNYGGGEPGATDISEDPLYCDTARGNFSLELESPCILIEGGGCDTLIGARGISLYDCLTFSDAPIAAFQDLAPRNDDTTIGSLIPEFSWAFYDTADGTQQEQYHLQVGSDTDWVSAEMWDSDSVASTDNIAMYAGIPLTDRTTYYYRIRLSNGITWGDWIGDSFTVRLGYITIGIPSDYPAIQQGIASSYSGDTVQVEPGTYNECLDYGGKNVYLRSSAGAHQTIITNDPESTLIVFGGGEDRGAILEGFTLHGGWIGVLCESSAPTLRRNLFVGQNSDDWAAISLAGPGYPGSTETGPSAALIENCTIVSSANGGISTFSTEAPTIINSIVAFADGYGIHKRSGVPQPILAYNDVHDCDINYLNNITVDSGSISADPMFTDSFSLGWDSPCIDAGHPDPQYNDPDLTRNDMGALPLLQNLDYPVVYDIAIDQIGLIGCSNSLTPILTWRYRDTAATDQSSYQIQVGTDEDWILPEMWDSGEQESADSSVIYSGSALADLTTYYLRVRVGTGSRWGQWCYGEFCTLVNCCLGLRGNVDYDLGDGINVADLTFLVGYLFGGGSPPLCVEEANVDGDIHESVNIADLTFLVTYLFGQGDPPAPCP